MKIPHNFFFSLTLCGVLTACQWWPNHHLIYPERLPESILAWSEDHKLDELLIHLEWACPPGEGPYATVIVHPEGGKTANEMRGIIWSLAENGYLAVAVDYRRYIGESFVRNAFPWRDEKDITATLDIVRSSTIVKKSRMAVLGFSQGAIFSLLIAAHASAELKTVVAYYPVTDFELWFSKRHENPIKQIVFWVIRQHFYRQSGALSEQQFEQVLYKSSVMNFANSIDVPVLLVHGDKDGSADIEESLRLKRRFDELGKSSELFIVNDGVHIFNFRQEIQAREAWSYTLEWLRRYL